MLEKDPADALRMESRGVQEGKDYEDKTEHPDHSVLDSGAEAVTTVLDPLTPAA